MCVCLLLVIKDIKGIPCAENITVATRIKMAAHGIISEFSSAQETWTSYVERLKQYLAANKVEDADQHKAILLSVCGLATYRNLASPNKSTELKFQAIVDLITKHHDLKAICYCPEVSFQHKKPPGRRIDLNVCSRASSSV